MDGFSSEEIQSAIGKTSAKGSKIRSQFGDDRQIEQMMYRDRNTRQIQNPIGDATQKDLDDMAKIMLTEESPMAKYIKSPAIPPGGRELIGNIAPIGAARASVNTSILGSAGLGPVAPMPASAETNTISRLNSVRPIDHKFDIKPYGLPGFEITSSKGNFRVLDSAEGKFYRLDINVILTNKSDADFVLSKDEVFGNGNDSFGIVIGIQVKHAISRVYYEYSKASNLKAPGGPGTASAFAPKEQFIATSTELNDQIKIYEKDYSDITFAPESTISYSVVFVFYQKN